MEIKDINTIEDIRVQRMYLQLQELKIILNNAKDSVTGEILLDNTSNEHVRHILKSLTQTNYFSQLILEYQQAKPHLDDTEIAYDTAKKADFLNLLIQKAQEELGS